MTGQTAFKAKYLYNYTSTGLRIAVFIINRVGNTLSGKWLIYPMSAARAKSDITFSTCVFTINTRQTTTQFIYWPSFLPIQIYKLQQIWLAMRTYNTHYNNSFHSTNNQTTFNYRFRWAINNERERISGILTILTINQTMSFSFQHKIAGL